MLSETPRKNSSEVKIEAEVWSPAAPSYPKMTLSSFAQACLFFGKYDFNFY